MDNFWIGATVISVCVGFQFGLLPAFYTIGGILLFAGCWEALDDSIVKYRNSGK